MKDKINNIFESRDKQIVPFLMLQSEIRLLGTRTDGSIIYFQFSPKDKCQQLVNDFLTKKAPLAQPKDVLDSLESFRDIIFEAKMKEKRKHVYKNY